MKEEIQKAIEVLRNGGVILYPTDTVWGIGCDATDPEAVAKVYALKRREEIEIYTFEEFDSLEVKGSSGF